MIFSQDCQLGSRPSLSLTLSQHSHQMKYKDVSANDHEINMYYLSTTIAKELARRFGKHVEPQGVPDPSGLRKDIIRSLLLLMIPNPALFASVVLDLQHLNSSR